MSRESPLYVRCFIEELQQDVKQRLPLLDVLVVELPELVGYQESKSHHGRPTGGCIIVEEYS